MAIFGKNNLYLNIFLILITLSIISISLQADSNATNAIDTSNSTTLATDTTNSSTVLTDTINSSTVVTETTNINSTISTDTMSSTESTDDNNSTNSEDVDGNSTVTPTFRNTSSGLSAGGIVAIVVPCALALIGVGLAAAFCKSTPAAMPPITPNVMPQTIDSSMSKFNTQPVTTVNNLQEITEVSPPVKNVEVIQPTPVVQQHPIYPISKEPPTIPQDNRVFQPLYPSQAINVSQSSPQVSQVIPKHEILASQSQLNPGQVVQGINTSQATNQSQVLPVKVSPIVD